MNGAFNGAPLNAVALNGAPAGEAPEPPTLPVGTQWAARTEAVGWAWTNTEGR